MNSKEAWKIVNAAWTNSDAEAALNTLLSTHNRREVRARAAERLSDLPKITNPTPLLTALRDRSSLVRGKAALACGECMIQAALQPLVDQLENVNSLRERDDIIRALGMLQSSLAREALLALSLELHKQHSLYSAVAQTIATSLGWILMAEYIPNAELPNWSLAL